MVEPNEGEVATYSLKEEGGGGGEKKRKKK